MEFDNKVAIVTGGGSGIGLALCCELSKKGAKVILADIDEVAAIKEAEAINRRGGYACPACIDVTLEEDLVSLIDRTVLEYGKLDYIFNNAGIGGTMDYRRVSTEHWKRLIDLNLWGVIYGTTAAYQVMVRQGFGHIINTASISGLTPCPTQTIYNTTKYAVVGLSTTLRYEASLFGVKVSVICPGPVKSRIFGTPVFGDREKEGAYFVPPQAIDADKAAKIILRGVVRNKEKIVFPFADRMASWLYRIHPALLKNSYGNILRNFDASKK